MDFKDTIKEITQRQIEALMLSAYEEGVEKGKLLIKQVIKEKEDKAYIIHDDNTYVDLEYEHLTNKRRLGMDLNNMKRTYFELGLLIKEEGKYVPNPVDNTFILVENKLYIKQDELCVLYLVHSKQRFIFKGIYEEIKLEVDIRHDELVKHLYNIANIENKQRNPIYTNIRDLKKSIEGGRNGI